MRYTGQASTSLITMHETKGHSIPNLSLESLATGPYVEHPIGHFGGSAGTMKFARSKVAAEYKTAEQKILPKVCAIDACPVLHQREDMINCLSGPLPCLAVVTSV